jgi:hypothetical protein
MTVYLSALAGAGAQFFDDDGVPLAGGKLYSYQAGTTTPQTTYTSAAGNTAHTNPIILNSAGRVSTGEIWLTAGVNYKFVLKTSTDVLLVTWDNIDGVNDITLNAELVTYDPPFTNAVSTTVENKLSQYPTLTDFTSTAKAISAASGNFKVLVNSNVTVQIPTDAATLQTAVDCLAPNNPQVIITLNIASGHQPASGITVSNGDYSQFRITSTDAVVTLAATFGITQNFIYGSNAELPVLACLVDADSKANYGYAAIGASLGYVESGCGVKNVWGDGCRAYGSAVIYAQSTIWTGCAQNNTTGSGIISWGGFIYARYADVSNSMYYGAQAAHGGILVMDNGTANNCFRYNLRASDAGWLSADTVTANYAGCDPSSNLPYASANAAGYGLYAFNGCWIAARDASAINAKSTGILATNASNIHARGATLTGAGEYGVQASTGSKVDATETTVSNAKLNGYWATGASSINATSGIANTCGTTTSDAAVLAEQASTINFASGSATNAVGDAIRAGDSSTINANAVTITTAGRRAAYAYGGSDINAASATATGAVTEGVRASSGSSINIQSANFQRGGSTAVTDIVVDNGSFINAAAATGGVSQTVNVLTSNGVIFR